jgi:hypothetical protein
LVSGEVAEYKRDLTARSNGIGMFRVKNPAHPPGDHVVAEVRRYKKVVIEK